MKQTNPLKLAQGAELLAHVKELRGGRVLELQQRMSNDPTLLHTFVEQ